MLRLFLKTFEKLFLKWSLKIFGDNVWPLHPDLFFLKNCLDVFHHCQILKLELHAVLMEEEKQETWFVASCNVTIYVESCVLEGRIYLNF